MMPRCGIRDSAVDSLSGVCTSARGCPFSIWGDFASDVRQGSLLMDVS